MRLIDADALLQTPIRITGMLGGKYPFEAISVSAIENAPTIALPSGWVSVKDRLPDKEEEVLLACETRPNRYVYCCKGFYIPENTYRDESDFSWDFEALTYDEEKDDYLVNSGWYERIHNWDEYGSVAICDFVTHWAEIELPKEEV